MTTILVGLISISIKISSVLIFIPILLDILITNKFSLRKIFIGIKTNFPIGMLLIVFISISSIISIFYYRFFITQFLVMYSIEKCRGLLPAFLRPSTVSNAFGREDLIDYLVHASEGSGTPVEQDLLEFDYCFIVRLIAEKAKTHNDIVSYFFMLASAG